MTKKATKLFNEVLDLNWNANRENKNFTKKLELFKKLGEKKEALKKEMGEAEYNKFFEAGQKLFS